MSDMFTPSFWKFSTGFMGIIIVGVIGVFVIGYFDALQKQQIVGEVACYNLVVC